MELHKIRVRMLRLLLVPVCIAGLFFGRPPGQADSAGVVTVEAVGFLLLLFGVGLRLWAILYIGQRKSKELVTTGPYSLCRNPLYLGTFAIVPGIALCFENIPLAAVMLVLVVAAHYPVTLHEERRLHEFFGDAFVTYQRSVPRFLPVRWQYRSPGTFEVSTRALRRALVELAPILMVPILSELVETLQAHHIIPILWKTPWL